MQKFAFEGVQPGNIGPFPVAVFRQRRLYLKTACKYRGSTRTSGFLNQ
jgi:hypothetical protein